MANAVGVRTFEALLGDTTGLGDSAEHTLPNHGDFGRRHSGSAAR
jgi:hypothetical protein